MMNIIKLFIVFTTFWSIGFSARAEKIEIYDASEPGMIVIEAVDDCEYSHKLLISLENAVTQKSTDWISLLIKLGEWNKCEGFLKKD